MCPRVSWQRRATPTSTPWPASERCRRGWLRTGQVLPLSSTSPSTPLGGGSVSSASTVGCCRWHLAWQTTSRSDSPCVPHCLTAPTQGTLKTQPLRRLNRHSIRQRRIFCPRGSGGGWPPQPDQPLLYSSFFENSRMPKITFLYHHLFVISFHTVNKMLFKLGASRCKFLRFSRKDRERGFGDVVRAGCPTC